MVTQAGPALYIFHGHTLPEVHLGTLDGPDRHSYAGTTG